MFKIFRKNLIVFVEDGKTVFKTIKGIKDEGGPNEKA